MIYCCQYSRQARAFAAGTPTGSAAPASSASLGSVVEDPLASLDSTAAPWPPQSTIAS